MMDILERIYILRETKQNKQTNEKLTVKTNIIFETMVQKSPIEG
jgi:hypothetical protein